MTDNIFKVLFLCSGDLARNVYYERLINGVDEGKSRVSDSVCSRERTGSVASAWRRELVGLR